MGIIAARFASSMASLRCLSSVISSRQNSLVKHIVKLHDSRVARENNVYIAEGDHIIETVVSAGGTIRRLFILEGQPVPANWHAQQVIHVTESVARKISQTNNPSRYLAEVERITSPAIQAEQGGVILAEVADPGNAGTIIRAAVAFGVRQIVALGGVDLYSHKCVQAAAGALALASVHQLPPTVASFGSLRGGAPLHALVPRDGSSLETASIRPPCWLIIGNESRGIQEELLTLCDNKVTIQMKGKIESMNAAVAAGIACYVVFGSHRE